MEEYKAKQIGILGFGVEGSSLAKFLVSRGCNNITVFDEKKTTIEGDYRFVSGPFESADLSNIDILFRSPGISPARLAKFVPASIEITTPTNLFFKECRGKTIGITGTKGKSTTALLLSEVVRSNNITVHVAGNIGEPMLDLLDKADNNSYCILELSSFQLQDLKTGPDVALILPIYSDHLDYHKDEDEYILAKKSILNGRADQVVISDLESLRKLGVGKNNLTTTFSIEESGADFSLNGKDFIGGNADESLVVNGALDFAKNKKIPIVNLLAVFSTAHSLGLKFELNALKDFKKLPFRVEEIGTKQDVRFFNDSASTNPLSTLAAIEMMDRDCAVIMGGSGKGLDYSELAMSICENSNITFVYLIGQTASEIREVLGGDLCQKTIIVKSTLSEVFEDLKNKLPQLKSVLFSPASASFDQYANYKQRGGDFNQLFEKL